MVVEMEFIIEATARVFDLPKWRIFQRNKYRPIITMRICAYHAADRLHHSYTTIANALGRHISTVCHVLDNKALTKEEEEKVKQIIELAQKLRDEGVSIGRRYQDCNQAGDRGRGSNAGPRTFTRARSRSYNRPIKEVKAKLNQRSQDSGPPVSRMADRPHYRKPGLSKKDHAQSA